MGRVANFDIIDGVAVFPLQSLIRRLNRHLRDLIPTRELYYKTYKKDFYLRVRSADPTDALHEIGPYYYSHMIALADHIGMWSAAERAIANKAVADKWGAIFTQDPLPLALQFKVVSRVLLDAQDALRALGATVEWPQAGR